MLKIEVSDSGVQTRQVHSSRTGQDYKFREQSAWAFFPGEAYPRPISFQLGDEAEPYGAGRYSLSPESFAVNRYGQLELRRRLVLLPLK